ncbi:MAG TPA: hypothetical protein PKH72_04910 [Rhodoferax sp.]|jgi:hypothetical protein|nr:hypothetical protein [Rhodoferax sp.]HNV58971.1 hypothetical protein [Rhodoferax sp.]HPW28189.1 hypothetical protein [Rhodoferax sp.]
MMTNSTISRCRRDLDDIRALLKIHLATLDVGEVREYFSLFNKAELLNELLGQAQ